MRSPAIVDATAPELTSFFASGWEPDAVVVASVAEILASVRAGGDDALVEYVRRWDDPTWSLASLRVPIPRLEAAERLVPSQIAKSLHVARERVARFHARQRRTDVAYDEDDGTHYAFVTRPLAAVAAYVPGGSAPLPSTAIMTVVPAKLAGVERIVVLTPPQRSGGVNPAVVYACALCGADELYAVGGAQAVAAAAYGTASIARVDKIVGPGNVWVTEAKRQVAGVCAIDGLAGPSEVLVVADETASPELVAGELLAQAEHDPQARVAAASESRATLERVAETLAVTDATTLPRGEIIAGVIERRCRLIHAATLDQLCEIVERFAPEHLSLRLDAPERVLERVRRVGAVFVGEATPVACGDYLAGSNHVLPTSGSARFASGLSLADFTRTLTVVRNSDERMRGDAEAVATLAEFEGLAQHARTARMAAERPT